MARTRHGRSIAPLPPPVCGAHDAVGARVVAADAAVTLPPAVSASLLYWPKRPGSFIPAVGGLSGRASSLFPPVHRRLPARHDLGARASVARERLWPCLLLPSLSRSMRGAVCAAPTEEAAR